MSNPIPISDPSGLVYTYACAHCRQMLGGVSGMVKPYDDETIKRHAEHYFDLASSCCVCPRCGKLEVGAYHCVMCEACKVATKPERDAQQDRWEAEAAAEQVVYEAHLSKALDRDAALLLEDLMSEISEDCYCAGWLGDLEYDLWRRAFKGASPRYGMGTIEASELQRLRDLSAKAGGWWKHRRFVPMADWLAENP